MARSTADLMALFKIDPLAIVTFQRLRAVRAFIDLLDASLPAVELRQREELEQVAKDEGWDFDDYSVETQVLDQRFGHWMPRSIVILLQSIVEAQLFACAERVGHEQVTRLQAAGRSFQPWSHHGRSRSCTSAR